MTLRAYVWLAFIALFSIGCGGGNGNNDQDADTPSSGQEIIILPDKTYRVYRGDKLVKQTPDARVRISHTKGTNETFVTLLQGQALIIRR